MELSLQQDEITQQMTNFFVLPDATTRTHKRDHRGNHRRSNAGKVLEAGKR